MRNHFLSAVACCCALCAAVSCGDDDGRMPDYSKPAEQTIAFRCTSAWGGDNPTLWTDESRVGLYCEQTGSVNTPLAPAAISAGEAEGLFYTRMPWEKSKEYLFYLYAPYGESNTSTLISGSLSAAQMQNGASSSHVDGLGLAYAAVTASEPSETPLAVTLKQVFGYLDLSVSTTKWAGWTMESIQIESLTDAALAGPYTFDLASGKLAFGSDASKSLLLRVSGGELSGEPFHAYAVTAPSDGTPQRYGITVTVARENESSMVLTGEVSLDGGLAPEEQTSLTLPIDTFDEAMAEDNSIDLSDPDGDGTHETANCYVASLAGQTYRFPANVMGNGATTPATPGYAGAGSADGIVPAPLAPASAGLLWQTAPNLLLDVKLRGTEVYFTTNGTAGETLSEGNAVIAVFDASGNILWSWHIWVTAADLDAAVQTYVLPGGFAAAGTTVMMDRNLGALKSGLWETNGNNLALGLLYQWGRKDPFPNIDDADMGGTGALAITRLRKTYDAAGNALTTDNTSTDLSATSWRYINGKALSAEQIARYPMNFTCANSNWIDTPQDDLWGNPYSDEIGDTGHKSIYDPCPPGYRVPHRYVGTPFTVDGLNAVKTYEGWNAQYKTQAEIQAAGGNIFSFGNGQSSYPLGGMLFLNSGAIVPFRTGKYVGHYQVSMPASNATKSYRFYFDYANLKPDDNNARYIGGSVRCMKIQ
jgi:hypothetical protein